MNSLLRLLVRQSLSEYLTDTCTIERRRVALDPYGAALEAWETVLTTACRVIDEPQRTITDQTGMQTRLPDRTRIIFPRATVIGEGYRVILSNGERYSVTEVLLTRTDDVDVQAYCARFSGAGGGVS